MLLAISCWTFVRVFVGASATVALENIALRHQLVVLQRSVSRPRFRRRDRAFWVCLSRLWRPWRSSLLIVQPATVVAWHRKGFQLYWRWRFRAAPIGRPLLDPQVRTLIRRMACENPTWGRRRIQAELHFLGYDVAELTVAKYRRRGLAAIKSCARPLGRRLRSDVTAACGHRRHYRPGQPTTGRLTGAGLVDRGRPGDEVILPACVSVTSTLRR